MIDKLSFLKGGADGGAVSPDEERLMQLFQNRAGLKKAYADLKDEFHLLRDRLKQQEGATIRVQEQLDALGDLLGDPKTGFGALVFFQLRALWKTCHQQLSTFATDLTRQQEAREMAKHKADIEAAKNARLADVDQRLQAASAEADMQRQHLAAAQSELGRLTAFWHYFKRRRRQKSLESLRSHVVRRRLRRSAICMPNAAPSSTRRRPSFPASRWPRAATSIWPSSATPNCCASTWMRSGWRRAPRRPWRAGFTR